MTYILIVEDDHDHADILSVFLGPQSLPIRHLVSAHGVIDLIKSDPPALIFLDVNLPDDDGRVLCRTIKDRLGDATPPIVVMSAGGESYRSAALAMGADGFLNKPIEIAQVHNILATHLPT